MSQDISYSDTQNIPAPEPQSPLSEAAEALVSQDAPVVEAVASEAPTTAEEGSALKPLTADQYEASEPQWFVLRDLKRINAKYPAYKELRDRGFSVFTPLKWVQVKVRGRRRRFQVPVLSDLVFVHSSRQLLDPVISSMPTLQYRYVRDAYCKPLVVRDVEMERFIRATTLAPDPKMLSISEVEKLSVGKDIKIVGGPFEGIEGKIVNVRGARKKRILVSIPDIIAAIVEVEPEYVKISESISK